MVPGSDIQKFVRRRIRPAPDIDRLISNLLLQFSDPLVTDGFGTPLLREDAHRYYREELSKHCKCLQDSENVPLYRPIGTVTRHGVELVAYRWSRGTSSFESFHQHVKTFASGTRISAILANGLLAMGICQWNIRRRCEKLGARHPDSISPLDITRYVDRQQTRAKVGLTHADDENEALLSALAELRGDPCNELFLCDYLLKDHDLEHIEKALEEEEEEPLDESLDDSTLSEGVVDEDLNDERLRSSDSESDDTDEPERAEDDNEVYRDRFGIGGFDKVVNLAKYLVDLPMDSAVLSDTQATRIIDLWAKLEPYDRAAPSIVRASRKKGEPEQ